VLGSMLNSVLEQGAKLPFYLTAIANNGYI
jgi:hypothetical protein